MVDIQEYGAFETAWCPGCGNFGLLNALKKALVNCGLAPHEILLVSGIGQAAKTPHYLNANVFNGLHGRSLPVAIGAKLANTGLTVIAESGDGCMYGEGGNHFFAALRRNLDITILVHDNRIYALTKGQASPTSISGFVTKAQPRGVLSSSFNPLAMAVAMGCGFVGRGYVAKQEELVELIARAIRYRGTALVDIQQPCVSFNHVNTYQWYGERCRPLPDDYDAGDFELAFRTALEFGDRIPLGVIYEKEPQAVFEDNFKILKEKEPLSRQKVDYEKLAAIIDSYT